MRDELIPETTNERFQKYLALACLASLVKHLEDSLNITLAKGCIRVRYHSGQNMLFLDYETIEALELVSNVIGEKKSTLFAIMNSCKTPSGSNLLRKNLLEPPSDMRTIQTRHELVGAVLTNDDVYFKLACILGAFPDLENAISQLTQV